MAPAPIGASVREARDQAGINMVPMTEIHLRAARDRLLDLLGIGETFPLQDIPVAEDRVKVAINSTAKIRLLAGQKDVRYSLLYDRDGKPVNDSWVPGTG